jgi:hypothetical protein
MEERGRLAEQALVTDQETEEFRWMWVTHRHLRLEKKKISHATFEKICVVQTI